MSTKFDKRVNLLLDIINEDNVAQAGGAFGGGASIGSYSPPNAINSFDSYAAGDARTPVVLGSTKKKGKKKAKFLVQRRNLN